MTNPKALNLVAVFWEHHTAEDGDDAAVHEEDALIIYLTSKDGSEVRLTTSELDHVNDVVTGEIARQEEDEMASVLANGILAGRMAGCQSTSHTECYGELWECASCGKIVCCNEGSTHDPDLCDDCWAKKYSPRTMLNQLEDDVPF